MSTPADRLPASSASRFALQAKRLEEAGVRQLAGRVELVDAIGHLIHALQRERGASSVFLASSGVRFAAVREQCIDETRPPEARLRTLFEAQLDPAHGASARMLSLMAWVLLGLDALAALRSRIDHQQISAHDSVAAYSHLIAGPVELIFHVADAALLPGVSRLLVAFLHLVQGKEAAGQERAVGALLFASGRCSEAHQQRLVHLVEAQERAFKVFAEFAGPALRAPWEQLQAAPEAALLGRLRRQLRDAVPGADLDSDLSDPWFEVASGRIVALWRLEVDLLQQLRVECDVQIAAAEQDLQDSEGLLKRLRDNPPPHTHAVDRFFDIATRPDTVPALASSVGPNDRPEIHSLLDLLEAQSSRLAHMEAELEAARRALHERKVVERAKALLMARAGMTEDAAWRALQKISMDQNRRLLDVAEATLGLPLAALAALASSPT